MIVIYIHAGVDKVILTSEVIAIFDISNGTPDEQLERHIENIASARKIEIIGDDIAKSVIVTEDRVYYSPISVVTLKKRAEQLVIE